MYYEKNKIFLKMLIIFITFTLIATQTVLSIGEGEYKYTDNCPYSQNPPGGLKPSVVPQFVVIGFDDNQNSDGMKWIVDYLQNKKNAEGAQNTKTFDGSNAHVSFYCTPAVGEGTVSQKIIDQWKRAKDNNHEIGNHTYTHPDAKKFTTSKWNNEITKCTNFLSNNLNINSKEIFGFRAPYLSYNSNTFNVIKDSNIMYDCSVAIGWQKGLDATNYYWPFTLDNGSPEGGIAKVAGLWEMPVYNVIIPPEIRHKYDKKSISGKCTGGDYNLWFDLKVTAEDYVKILKYSLDQRMKDGSNRSPMIFCAHTHYYSKSWDKYWAKNKLKANLQERQHAMEEFIDYALSIPEVRVVSTKECLDWLRSPVPLK